MRFDPSLHVAGQMGAYPSSVIKNEPMVFSADVDFARFNGGPLTLDFLRSLYWSKEWIIDTRVHMLMGGWYPCIPGWHHDDVIRNRSDGQPNYSDESWDSPMHRCAVIEATDTPTGSLTEFLNEPIDLDLDTPSGQTIYGHWNQVINEDERRITTCKSGTVYEFGTSDFHRGTPAKHFGWRFFARATHKSQRPILNEMRRQVQTYLPAIEGGW